MWTTGCSPSSDNPSMKNTLPKDYARQALDKQRHIPGCGYKANECPMTGCE
jgi:hypothetical protein